MFWTSLPSLVFCEFPALITPWWSRKDHVRGQYTSIPIARKWSKNHRQPQCTGQGVTDGWACGYLLWPSFYDMIFEHISWWRCTIKNSFAICSFLFYLARNNMARGSFHCMRLPTHQWRKCQKRGSRPNSGNLETFTWASLGVCVFSSRALLDVWIAQIYF